jgi:predicted nucleic acid-binding protein
MIIIADASPLVTLAVCDCLRVLESLFDEVQVAQTVYDEVIVENKPGANKLKDYFHGKVSDLTLDNTIISGDSLDDRELYSIALFKQLHADYLLIDEKAGRRLAKLNQIKIIGSLGVLI